MNYFYIDNYEPKLLHASPTERNYAFSVDYAMHRGDSDKAN